MGVTPLNTPPAEKHEVDRLKSAFLSSLNHEIRTPVSGMLGLLDLLLETPLNEEQKGYVTTTKTCAEDLFRLLSATLEYASLESGGTKLDESEFSVKEVVGAAVDPEAAKAAAKGLRLVTTLDATLPETLIGDAGRITQVISHLLDNGVKFTQRGSVELKLSFEPLGEGRGRLNIAVCDTGIGIPSEQRQHLFESFGQLDQGPTRNYPGVGLGLALSSKLVSLMGGAIEVQSEPGVGSIFRVHLRLRIPEQLHAAATVAEPPAKTTTQDSASTGTAILAVDDNPVGLTVIRRALERQGVQADTVLDGESALRAVKNKRYDLILMDLQMPVMDGLQTTVAIRKVAGYENVPVLALTADFSDETRIRCQRQGLQGFIAKPVEATVLWQTIQRFLNQPARRT